MDVYMYFLIEVKFINAVWVMRHEICVYNAARQINTRRPYFILYYFFVLYKNCNPIQNRHFKKPCCNPNYCLSSAVFDPYSCSTLIS